MTLDEFATKVEWEGGVVDALRYGLKADDLKDDDPRALELYEVWEALESAWLVVARLESEAEEIIESHLDERDDEEEL